ncbi:MAG: FAD-dependent oxidoreductase [Verrucomicrobiales bacterium]|nr:FAD-dependent oxidoreductase [Verrucomicrobiales bacterium]
MKTLSHSSKRHLVFVGGGHTHALVLLALGKAPLPNCRITLISDVELAPYSGMLPGRVAGIYDDDEMHIDLPRLCRFAGADFVSAHVSGYDPESGILQEEGGEALDLRPDFISFNVGSAPKLDAVAGAQQWAIPSKPVPTLLEGWARVREAATQISPDGDPLRIVVVGGGAGGVELTLAMQSQLPESTCFDLVHGGDHLLPGHNDRVRWRFTNLLAARGITTRLGTRVVEVLEKQARLDDGSFLKSDFVFWVTQPAPPKWLQQTGLELNEKGFLRVTPTLECVGQRGVFAAGDVASIEDTPLPKSGVYAVRMATPLEANLRAAWAGDPLGSYEPQRHILSLIGTADGRAVVSRPWLPTLHSRIAWWWKDRIDQRFMRQFVEAERSGGTD